MIHSSNLLSVTNADSLGMMDYILTHSDSNSGPLEATTLSANLGLNSEHKIIGFGN